MRSFYIKRVHEVIMKESRAEWAKSSGTERQKRGRKAWASLEEKTKGEIMSVWVQASRAPDHVANFAASLCSEANGAGKCKVKTKGRY